MQINKVNTAVPRKTRQGSGRNENKINNNKTNPNFKGVGAGLDKFALATAELIENGGLAISFTLQDMLGTNLPRPIMGLMRNSKENKGEKNKSFAFKELVREMLTGPSMFLIPMGILAVAKKPLGATVNTPMKFIKDFGKIHAANPLGEAGKAITKEVFFKNTFSEILKNANLSTDKIEGKATDYAKKLAENLKDKDALKKVITELSDDFVGIVKNNSDDVVFTDFTIAKVSEKTAAPFKETIEHMIAYADDVVVKAAKQADTSKLPEYIKKLSDNKILTRAGMNVGMYASVLGFLQIIPRLYNKAEGEGNSGLKGLMKEETLNDKSLENNTTQNKANPSFGSAAPKQAVINTLTGEGKGILGKILGKLASWSEFEGCNVSFPFLLGIMGIGIFLPRLTQAKDKYDREEILRRDAVTCATMCFGEHELRKGFSKLNEKSSGFVLADKGANFKQQNLAKRLFDYIRPIKGVQVMSTDQIVSKYSGLDKYNGGINGFCKFIDNQGGKLSKVFSLTDEAKELADKIVGKDIKGLDNKTIKEAIASKIDSDDVKALTKLFDDKGNAWVKKAKTLNARFTALSVLLIVPLFLGFALPAINERATKKRIYKEKEALAAQQTSAKNSTPNFFVQNQKTSKIFSDIANFNK
ncbi:MAG: hypothetical protein IJY61_05715 [Candidatus Gastranaerophilales bacterium]|nr:hypothetical protein [Candidatus Gastranaerophilales bacterium]